MTDSKPYASLSVDLDNLWCYQRSFGKPEWQAYNSFFPDTLPTLLSFLGEHQVTATFFVVGLDAEQSKNHTALRQIAAQGHEIGNHSYRHDTGLHLNESAEILRELTRAHKVIEQATSKAPVGFRGPAFGVSRGLLSALSTLGYQFDASILRNSAGALARQYHKKRATSSAAEDVGSQSLYGSIMDGWQTMQPFRWQSDQLDLIEIPVTSMPIFRIPFHGTYLQYIADRSEALALVYFKFALLLCRLRGVSPSFLLHLTDFIGCDSQYDLEYLPGMKRTTQQKILFMRKVMNIFQKSYAITGIQEFLNVMPPVSVKSFEGLA